MRKARAVSLFSILAVLSSCTWDKVEVLDHGYPAGIGEIVVQRCATSGCHTTQSAPAAAGLNLQTWDALFKGSRGGSPVVPGWPDYSYLLYAVNTDTNLGPTLEPTMPVGGQKLTAAEYDLLREWILDGARSSSGALRFPDIAGRRKWYVANQGCDLVAVLDAASRQIMRFVPLGALPANEYPHNIKVSTDGQFWYAVFLSQNPRLEKYSTLTDQKVGEIVIGEGNWNTFNIAPDGRFGIAVSYKTAPGPAEITVVIVDLLNDVVSEPLHFDDAVHGSCAHPTLPRFYVTKQDGNEIIAIDYDNDGHVSNVEPIDLVQGTPAHNGVSALKPHEVIFSPDGSKFFVTCQLAGEVRVYNGQTNQLLDVIEVGDDPVEFAMDGQRGHLFVSCMEDASSWGGDPLKRGSIAIIDIASNGLIDQVYSGFQPHGMVVDQASGILVVANRNVSQSGPAPHHSAACGGRNGYLTAIGLESLQLVPDWKAEMASDPYAIAIKP